MTDRIDLIGAMVAVAFYISAMIVFLSRIVRKPKLERWMGIFEFLLAPPMFYLLLMAPQLGRPALYYIQIGLMLTWLAAEAVLDYILKIDFRQKRWITVAYVMLFFAGSGGMLGVASYAGRGWSIAALISFLIMTVLTFAQRHITGK